jgi:hypothetical protein
MKKSTTKFDTASPGFLYSAIVAFLTLFAVSGVSFPKEVSVLGLEITTALSTGGIYAIIGVVITSVAFPIYNYFKGGGTFTWLGVFGKKSTWIALGNAAVAALATGGFMLPDGTVDQIIGAVQSQNWMGLISVLALTVGNTFIRWLKEKQEV